MNSARSDAYGRTVKLVEDLSPGKLHPAEQQIVRDAADELLFCEALTGDAQAEAALAGLYELVDNLVESERVSSETGQRLIAEVEACGPLAAVN